MEHLAPFQVDMIRQECNWFQASNRSAYYGHSKVEASNRPAYYGRSKINCLKGFIRLTPESHLVTREQNEAIILAFKSFGNKE